MVDAGSGVPLTLLTLASKFSGSWDGGAPVSRPPETWDTFVNQRLRGLSQVDQPTVSIVFTRKGQETLSPGGSPGMLLQGLSKDFGGSVI